MGIQFFEKDWMKIMGGGYGWSNPAEGKKWEWVPKMQKILYSSHINTLPLYLVNSAAACSRR